MAGGMRGEHLLLGNREDLPGASYELREAAARIKKLEIKFSRRLVEFQSGRSSL
jgi:hypothetical protein